MKSILSLLLPILLIFILGQKIMACSCGNTLRGDFKKARMVFLGKVVEVAHNAGIDSDNSDLVTLEMEKTWKGPREKTVMVSVHPLINYGSCSGFNFEKDAKYVVFANTKKLVVQSGCGSTFQIIEGDESREKKLKKLNSFWFRSWAKIYPF